MELKCQWVGGCHYGAMWAVTYEWTVGDVTHATSLLVCGGHHETIRARGWHILEEKLASEGPRLQWSEVMAAVNEGR